MDGATPAGLGGRRVAIVHYWFVTWRGGEQVVASWLKLFPGADIYTLFYDRAVCGPRLAGHRVVTSAFDVGPVRAHHQRWFPLYPAAVRSLRLDRRRDYDLVLSSESGPAKGVTVPPGCPHVCYVHSPMRYCWVDRTPYLRGLPRWMRPIADHQLERLRRWDLTTIDNVDRYVANSHNVAGRVRRCWNREAEVCHAPIALEHFDAELVGHDRRAGHYLSFGAITPYKRVDLLVEAFRRLPERRLVVVGEGGERARLEATAPPNVTFLGQQPWSRVRELLASTRALVFPGEEDFGLVPLEVMAHGVPVVALGAGGALETVVDAGAAGASSAASAEPTGLFFAEATPEAVIDAIARFESIERDFDPAVLRRHARQFGEDHYLERFAAILADTLAHPARGKGARR